MSYDYTQARFWFKVRKVARYVRLYGLSRTLIKVRGQYHMRSTGEFQGTCLRNPACKTPDADRRNVAIIGCGNFSYTTIAYYLSRNNPEFLRIAFDRNKSRALSLCKKYIGAYAVEDWRDIIADPQVKMVFIASNHASHAEYAVDCIEAGKHVHIEKPHVVTDGQLERLLSAMDRNPGSKVFLGFNRPRSPLFVRLQEALEREPGPAMINWFIAGHEIPADHWYFNEAEGGRVLGNLCHWTDLTLHLVKLKNAFPCTIIPSTPKPAKSDFVVSIIFADGSCASITFSAKGHSFEGVREVLNLHKGDLLANLSEFQSLRIDRVDKRKTLRLPHRDHGHEANIMHSYAGISVDGMPGEDRKYVAATARFFLAINQAIKSGRPTIVSIDDTSGVLA